MLNFIMQAAPANPGPSAVSSLLPFLLIGLVFYFLLIRPQNKRLKEHRAMLAAIVKGDTIVTNGGLIGKVTKATDEELTLDLGSGTKVKVVRSMIADVRNKTTPANTNTKATT